VTDSHAHLDACEEPAGALVERARAAGVTRIVTIGTGIESCRAALEIVDEHDGVFAALGIDDAAEIPGLFVPNFYFGCEADDPMNALAFLQGRWPFGAVLHAMYGSDIGHFDVPSLPDVLHEAWENVERGWMNRVQFRRFMFDNPARFYLESNDRFFAGTVVADDVKRLIAATRE